MANSSAGNVGAAGSRRGLVWALGLGLLVLAAMALGDYSAMDGLADTDDHMRAAWLADSMEAGQFPPSPLYSRTGGEHGLVIHWALLWNLVLLAFAAIPAQFVGWHRAFFLIAPYVETLVLLAAGAISAWIVAPFGSRAARMVAAGAAVVAPLFMSYAVPVRIDHHAPAATAVLLVAALSVRAVRSRRLSWAAAAGWMMPMSLWISADCAPLLLIAAGALGAAWTAEKEGTARMAAAMAAAAAASAAIWLVDPPFAGRLALDPYRHSILHPVLFSLLLVFLPGGVALGRSFWRSRRPVLALCAIGAAEAAALLSLYAIFPRLRAGNVELSRFPLELLSRIGEYRGIDTPDRAVLVLAPMIPALFAAAFLTLRARRAQSRIGWAAILMSLVAVTLPACLHVRFGPYAHLLAAPLTGIAFWQAMLLRRLWQRRTGWRRLAAAAGPLSVLVPLILGQLALRQPLAGVAWAGPATDPAPAVPCLVAPAAEFLDAQFPAGTLVFSNLGTSTQLISLTRLSAFAAPYHGYVDAVLQRYLDILGSPDARDGALARSLLAAEGVKAVIRCGGKDPQFKKTAKPDTFGMALAGGALPGWLVPVPLPKEVSGTSLEIYRLR